MERNESSELTKLLEQVQPVTNIMPDYLDDDFAIIDNHNPLEIMRTLKAGLYLVGTVVKGTISMNVEGESITLHASQLIILTPNQHVSHIVSSKEIDCAAFCVSSRLLQFFLGPFSQVWTEGVYVQRMRVLDIGNEEKEFMKLYYAIIRLLLNTQSPMLTDVYRKEMLKSVLKATLLGLCCALNRHLHPQQETPLRNVSLFNRFLQVLQQEQQKHRTVDYYAAKLCISSKYLTVVCKKNSGKTAREWIEEYTQADINHMLADTDLSLKEVSVRLGFPNQGFFGKYVKANYGCTPTQLRDKKRQNRS